MNNYLILVNKENKYENNCNFEIVDCHSEYHPKATLEKETFEHFMELRKEVEKHGYTIDVESGFRDLAYQQRIWDETEKEKGLEHTKRYVAVPGYSEHHTGLAVDFIVNDNGKWLLEEEMRNHEAVKLIHSICSNYGFILRYPQGKESITGYAYELWHLRYIKDVEIAKYIMENNLTFEEYLNNKEK